MRILACYIENFGSLHHVKCSLNKGLNSLNQRNGWGKSTFAVFLRAMFYGLDNPKNVSSYDPKDHRKNLNPWQGGNFGGYLEFETGGKEYRVTRFFGERKSDDSFELTDLETMKPSTDFTSSLGEELFGIDAYGYERSVYIPHNDLSIGTDDSVNTKLLGLLESDGKDNAYEDAVKLLTDARRELKKTGGRGKIDRDSEEKAGLEVRLRKALDGEKKTAEKKTELAAAVKEKEGCRAEREQAEKELTEFTEKNVSRGGKTGMLVFGVLLIILAIAAGAAGGFAVMRLPAFYFYGQVVSLAGAVLFLIALIILIARHFGIKKKTKEFAELQDRVTDKRKSFEAASEREGELKREIDGLNREYEDPEKLRQEIDRLQLAGNEDREKLGHIERTLELLSEARQSLSGHYMDRLKSKFSTYLEKAGMGSSGALMDTDFNISIERSGALHPVMSESSGLRDIINLSARFALIDALFENDKPCVILDDVMNNLDEERFVSAMRMTEEFAKDCQVIYLTCNSSRTPEQIKKGE